MQRHLIFVHTATGIVRTEWRGDDDQPSGAPVAKADTTLIDNTSGTYGTGTLTGHTWNGVSFVPIPVRTIQADVWWARWTDAEQVALEELAEPDTNAGRQVRSFFRATQLTGAINLDNPWLVTKLNQLAALFIANGTWADQVTADARIAQLLADG